MKLDSFFLILFAVIVYGCNNHISDEKLDLTQYVNPLIGTAETITIEQIKTWWWQRT